MRNTKLRVPATCFNLFDESEHPVSGRLDPGQRSTPVRTYSGFWTNHRRNEDEAAERCPACCVTKVTYVIAPKD